MKHKIEQFLKNISTTIIGSFLVVCLMFLGFPFDGNGTAFATTMQTPNLLATSLSSLSREVTGKAQEDIGTTQKKLGEVSGQVQGTAKQLKGRATRDLGRVQAKIEDGQLELKGRAREDLNKLQNAGDRVSDQITEAADRTGDAIAERTEKAVDSIKTFFER